MIYFDQQRLQQVLLNLISNAIKFTPFSGDVSVTARILSELSDLAVKDPAFEDCLAQANGKKFLEIQVQDTGVGIKPEDQKKLFKLFGFLEANKELNSKGIGLGLHISKKITRMFDGDIICRSQYGHGSNFVFIVALSSSKEVSEESNGILRIKNPVQKNY